MDTLTPRQRSERMKLVRSNNTRPELVVRGMVFTLGYRYRLHHPGVDGRPDLVFPARRRVIFVHGCFWHRHPAKTCRLARLPKSRLDFWLPKLAGNRKRDQAVERRLRRSGWKVMTIWECQLARPDTVVARVRRFMEEGSR